MNGDRHTSQVLLDGTLLMALGEIRLTARNGRPVLVDKVIQTFMAIYTYM